MTGLLNSLVLLLVQPVLRFVAWFFRREAPSVDVVMGSLAAGWTLLMILRPDIFDMGSFRGMAWLPDLVWISIALVLATAHAIGLLLLTWRNWRMFAALGSSWMWFCVAASFLRVDIGTGVVAYAIYGMIALLGGIYIGVLPRKAG